MNKILENISRVGQLLDELQFPQEERTLTITEEQFAEAEIAKFDSPKEALPYEVFGFKLNIVQKHEISTLTLKGTEQFEELIFNVLLKDEYLVKNYDISLHVNSIVYRYGNLQSKQHIHVHVSNTTLPKILRTFTPGLADAPHRRP